MTIPTLRAARRHHWRAAQARFDILNPHHIGFAAWCRRVMSRRRERQKRRFL